FLGLASHGMADSIGGSVRGAWFHVDARWTFAIAGIWAAASLLRGITLIAAALRVRTLSRRATPIALTSGLEAAAISRRAQICSSTDVDRPTVIGFFSPRILIPAWLLEKLTAAELEQIVLHEAGHLNRSDDWLNLLQKVALVLFPLNPALAWVERRLCFERELACDEHVLNTRAASDRAATDYASCLATLAGYRLERRGLVRNLALALGALGRESQLGRRVARILRPAARMRPAHARLAVGASVVTLLFAATQLERCPQIVSFAPVNLISQATAPQVANLSDAGSAQAAILPGYRAVATRVTLPAARQQVRSGDSAAHLASVPVIAQATAKAQAVAVRRDYTQQSPAPRMIADRAVQESVPQESLVITRWTVTAWQYDDGGRIVRTRAVFTNAPAGNVSSDSGISSSTGADPTAPGTPSQRTQVRQISQTVSPYAAVAVPGGWLIFQL
ncbi:MAG TPA: M56 family metallopeptidase, partial [Acidobacteriaceae bacterium]|nr:M56 family metallopeptidase [Acidobacteriaceae bacterium]